MQVASALQCTAAASNAHQLPFAVQRQAANLPVLTLPRTVSICPGFGCWALQGPAAIFWPEEGGPAHRSALQKELLSAGRHDKIGHGQRHERHWGAGWVMTD